jgi:hypothetical protein
MTARALFVIPHGIRFPLFAFVCVSLFSIVSQGQTPSPIFPLPVFSSTAVIAGAATGDFNGDGQADQAYISSSTAITVLLNQGANNPPTSVVTSGLTCTPQVLVAADMNNDKKLDVVLTCQEGYVVVLFGNGNGTFQTPSYYAVANVSNIAPPVDLNGDGYLDIAVTIHSNNAPSQEYFSAVAVLLNQGSGAPGALASPQSYSAPTGAGYSFSINVGDFNGDGNQDIIAGTPAVVFYGNGNGTLQTPVQTTATAGYVTGDFNGDGKTDIAYNTSAVAPLYLTSLQVLLGTSSGQFTMGDNLPLGASGYQIVPFQNTTSSNTINLALVGYSDTLIALGDGEGNFTAGQAYGVSGNTVIAQAGSSGNTNLLFSTTYSPTVVVTGNGDGTFQAPPATILNAGNAGTCAFVDLNGDGLTDTLCLGTYTSSLVAALGRGNGRFSMTSQYANTGQIIVTGDFNGDGKLDAVTLFPGVINPKGGYTESDAQFFFYSGNGDGTFQPSTTVDLQVGGAGTPLVGDFNGDGKLDLIIPYGGYAAEGAQPPTGVLFFAGKGDGTFAAPISLSIPWTSVGITADVNNDGKLDIIGGNTVNLGNGDGTFTQLPLGIPGTVLAIGDLNGDGNSDLVITDVTTGTNIYAGNGNGTFQTTPFYTASLPQYAGAESASIGTINANGNADLLITYGTTSDTSALAVFLGDGKGNFTADPNTYYTYAPSSVASVGPGTLGRVNNQAPSLPNDNALDFVFGSYGAVISFINQLNPAPTTPAPLPSKTVLTASANSAAPTQPITFTASVTGATPTGSVSFVSGSTTLGTAAVTNGVATLTTSFAAVGSYSVTASYPGDSNNSASSSNAVPISVAAIASSTALAVSATSANPAQQVSFTATVTGFNPTGNVTFVAGSTTLGTAPVANGVATLSTSFAAVGSYTVTANYAGDVANMASTSNAVSVSVATPDFTVSASPAAVTITAGQTATMMLSVTPIAGYSGTVTFSCGTLPSGVTCSFAPASVTPANGMASTSTLTIATTAPTTAMMRGIGGPLQGIAWAGMICLAFSPRRLWRSNRRLMRSGMLLVLLMSGLMALSGCSSGSPATTTPGTPKGTQTITVSVADLAGGPSHTTTVQITVQ